ncbi:MAG: ABC transporter ATP-binding protein, partial [Devosiaceae bacterium]|nr:ABC transporter ATP-binding protein [Devosiaceae bacterium MH13]
MSAHMALTVEGVEFTTPGGNQLLRPVSFALERGSVLAIAGPNGAGKTTLLNLLSGIESLKQGDVLIDGKSLKSMSPSVRAHKIALVSQHGNPDGRLRLVDYVALGQMPIWADRSVTEHADALANVLEITGLTPLSKSTMARLSGGERQRAHIARALAQEP